MVRNRGARYMLAVRQYAVCFDYNRGNCNRKAARCGCEVAKGIVYAHACNFFFASSSKHCLALHPKVGNH
jgi:hypothetical protein